MHLPTVEDFTSGSEDITNCSNTVGWKVGDVLRTASNGPMKDGARVTAISGTTITMSLPATMTKAGEHFHYMPLRLMQKSLGGAPTAGSYPPGAFVQYSTPTKDANNMVLAGWICVAGGNPGTWEPVYQSTVSPAV